MIPYYMVIALGTVFVLVFWVLYCNARTLRQRIAAIELINDYDGFGIFRKISYDRHLWTLCTFRDPAKLYPASLRKAFRSDRARA